MSLEHLYQLFLQSTGVCTDSRQAAPGMLFFALRGDHFNGNDYAASALESGCSAAVVDLPGDSEAGYIRVENVLQTLQDLATYHRKTLGIPVLAITGTNGKTTTKELIFAVLSKKFNVLATRGNFNNHIGVPLTLLGLKDEEMAVIEMGANHIGEIHELCTIADPDYGIITNIGFAHLEGFGSTEGVLQAKTELYRYLDQKKGTIFINGMNDLLTTSAASLNLGKIWYTDGKAPLVDGYIEEKSVLLKIMISFTRSAKYHVETRLTGNYNMENILAAACIGKYFGVPEAEIISAIESYSPSNNRSQYLETASNHLIIDAYNANPTSMNGAVKNFLDIAAPSRMLILGDMLELGQYTKDEHLKIIELLKEHPGIEVILVGPEFARAAQNTGYLSFYVVEDLIEHLRMNPVKDHLILLKGSRGIHLEKLIDVL